MIKKLIVLFFCCLAVMVSGCNKESSKAKTPITAIDTSAAEAQFRSASPEVRAAFANVVSAIKSGKSEEAETALRTLLAQGRLTPAQEQAARELMNLLQQPR